MQYKAFFSYLEEEIVIEKSNKSSIVLKEKKTSHLRKKQNTTKKRNKKNQCNAGQPQVPGCGRKVSREGKLKMKLLALGHLINLLFAGFKLTAPPCSALLLSVFLNPTSLQMVFFLFSVQRTIEQMLRCLRLFFVLNECFFSSFDINDMHVQTIFIEDLEKPLASVNCYFGLYIKT